MKRKTHHLPNLVAAAILLALSVAGSSFVSAADAGDKGQPGAVDYLEPKVLTGRIYANNSKEIIFTFRRTATASNSTVRVLREFARPNGTLAARERVVYESGRLVCYQLEEPESGAGGSAVVQRSPREPQEQRIVFEYTEDKNKKTGSEKLEKDTVINDMVAPFIQAHWSALMSGAAVKFRFVAIARAETVGFKFTKQFETTRQGKPVVVLRMEPTSWIIAQFVEPLRFTVEKEGQHRVLEYAGRTTPRTQRGNKWEDVDAPTVFDWK